MKKINYRNGWLNPKFVPSSLLEKFWYNYNNTKSIKAEDVKRVDTLIEISDWMINSRNKERFIF